jgi:hypothetical protein
VIEPPVPQGEALVFCLDQGDGSYGWFWHEADVLLYALGQEVTEQKITATQAREVYAQYYDEDDTYLIDPEDDDEPEVAPPGPDDAFDADSLLGYEEGDWPEFAPREMEDWVDREIIDEYGWYVQPLMNDSYPVIDYANEEKVVSLLEERGYVCIRDDDLVWKAIWGC